MIRKAAGIIISISWQILVCVVAVLLLIRISEYAYEFGKEIFQPTSLTEGAGREVIVTMEEDISKMDAAKLLQEEGLIRDWKVFFTQTLLYDATLYPGSYTLNSSMTSQEILDIMRTEPIVPGDIP